jgi:hypothetical protein
MFLALGLEQFQSAAAGRRQLGQGALDAARIAHQL